VSVLHFHGTKDGLVLYGGPHERLPQNIKFLSVDDCGRGWGKVNGCPRAPAVDKPPHPDPDGTSVPRTIYGPGKAGSEVVLYAIQGGGHTWPGREPRVPFLGKTTRDISANDLIWEFFQKHPLE